MGGIDELRQRVLAGHHDYAIMLAGGLALSRKTIRFAPGGGWHITNHIDDSEQTLSQPELWSESHIGQALDKRALLDMSGNEDMVNVAGRGWVEVDAWLAEGQAKIPPREPQADPRIFTLDGGPGALRMGEDEWEPAEPLLTLEPCDIGPATVASIDLAATGMAFNDGHAVMYAATSIELTIEDIDLMVATLTAIKWDAIENRGFLLRASGFWTNGIEED
jgi:hypothetical protein